MSPIDLTLPKKPEIPKLPKSHTGPVDLSLPEKPPTTSEQLRAMSLPPAVFAPHALSAITGQLSAPVPQYPVPIPSTSYTPTGFHVTPPRQRVGMPVNSPKRAGTAQAATRLNRPILPAPPRGDQRHRDRQDRKVKPRRSNRVKNRRGISPQVARSTSGRRPRALLPQPPITDKGVSSQKTGAQRQSNPVEQPVRDQQSPLARSPEESPQQTGSFQEFVRLRDLLLNPLPDDLHKPSEPDEPTAAGQDDPHNPYGLIPAWAYDASPASSYSPAFPAVSLSKPEVISEDVPEQSSSQPLDRIRTYFERLLDQGVTVLTWEQEQWLATYIDPKIEGQRALMYRLANEVDWRKCPNTATYKLAQWVATVDKNYEVAERLMRARLDCYDDDPFSLTVDISDVMVCQMAYEEYKEKIKGRGNPEA
ncbi:hypothetical protein F5Y13DRAFT_192147 [Hypoxylon sp. FL1857]|nr:hypothetical protein F5Y13DRAFT_192147 [Hypoxylon sp. FL1857]